MLKLLVFWVQPLPGKSQMIIKTHKMMDLEMHRMILLCPILIRICNAWYFVHRTFNGIDFAVFIRSLKNIYENIMA
jgi:hypothetical protein